MAALNVGEIFGRIGARFDPEGFKRFDAAMERVRTQVKELDALRASPRVGVEGLTAWSRRMGEVQTQTRQFASTPIVPKVDSGPLAKLRDDLAELRRELGRVKASATIRAKTQTAELTAMRAQLKELRSELAATQRQAVIRARVSMTELRSFQRGVGQVNSMLGRGADLAQRWGARVARAGAMGAIGLGVAGVAAGVVGLKYDQLREQATIAFTTMLGTGARAQRFLAQLQQFANRTPFTFSGLIVQTERLKAMGIAARDVIPLMKDIGDAAAALGTGEEGIQRITTAIGQMHQKGMVQAEEMRQLAEAGVPAWDALAKSLGTNVAGAMKLVQLRLVDSDKAIDAIRKRIEHDFGGMMRQQAHTLAGLWSTIKDTSQQFLGGVFKPLYADVEQGLERLTRRMTDPSWIRSGQEMGKSLAGVFQAPVDALTWLMDHWDEIKTDAADVADYITTKWDQAGPAIASTVGAITDAFSKLMPVAEDALNAIISGANAILPILHVLTGGVLAVVSSLGGARIVAMIATWLAIAGAIRGVQVAIGLVDRAMKLTTWGRILWGIQIGATLLAGAFGGLLTRTSDLQRDNQDLADSYRDIARAMDQVHDARRDLYQARLSRDEAKTRRQEAWDALAAAKRDEVATRGTKFHEEALRRLSQATFTARQANIDYANATDDVNRANARLADGMTKRQKGVQTAIDQLSTISRAGRPQFERRQWQGRITEIQRNIAGETDPGRLEQMRERLKQVQAAYQRWLRGVDPKQVDRFMQRLDAMIAHPGLKGDSFRRGAEALSAYVKLLGRVPERRTIQLLLRHGNIAATLVGIANAIGHMPTRKEMRLILNHRQALADLTRFALQYGRLPRTPRELQIFVKSHKGDDKPEAPLQKVADWVAKLSGKTHSTTMHVRTNLTQAQQEYAGFVAAISQTPIVVPITPAPGQPQATRREGGWLRRPTVIVAGEEAPRYPEAYVSTNPRDRSRMEPLVKQLADLFDIRYRATGGPGDTGHWSGSTWIGGGRPPLPGWTRDSGDTGQMTPEQRHALEDADKRKRDAAKRKRDAERRKREAAAQQARQRAIQAHQDYLDRLSTASQTELGRIDVQMARAEGTRNFADDRRALLAKVAAERRRLAEVQRLIGAPGNTPEQNQGLIAEQAQLVRQIRTDAQQAREGPEVTEDLFRTQRDRERLAVAGMRGDVRTQRRILTAERGRMERARRAAIGRGQWSRAAEIAELEAGVVSSLQGLSGDQTAAAQDYLTGLQGEAQALLGPSAYFARQAAGGAFGARFRAAGRQSVALSGTGGALTAMAAGVRSSPTTVVVQSLHPADSRTLRAIAQATNTSLDRTRTRPPSRRAVTL